MENPLDNCKSHKEVIICPECLEIQEAIVYHTTPFITAVHDCKHCNYTIMESEWQRVESKN